MVGHLLKVYKLPALTGSLGRRCIASTSTNLSGGHDALYGGERNYPMEKIGNREVVGFGSAGQANYVDRWDYPFPSIRFQEIKGPLVALNEKQKGDWKNLTIEEKKELYRMNFCQTFAEMNANKKGSMLWPLGGTLFLSGVAIWWFIFTEKYCLLSDPGLNPRTMTREWQEAMTRRMVDEHTEPITGISSKWDYEKKRWKE